MTQMDIRKPKPLHNWREFFGEIGVIVIGVTIALVGEQIVDAWRWRAEVAKVKETLNAEVREHLKEAEERLAIGSCEAKQLETLDAIVRSAGGLPPRLPPVMADLRSWTTNGWDIASTSGTVPHMTLEDRSDYSDHFAAAKLIGHYNDEEFLLLADLRTLRPSQALSEVARDRILSDIARAEQLNAVLQVASKQMLDAPIRSAAKMLRREDLAVIAKERSACETGAAARFASAAM